MLIHYLRGNVVRRQARLGSFTTAAHELCFSDSNEPVRFVQSVIDTPMISRYLSDACAEKVRFNLKRFKGRVRERVLLQQCFAFG